MHLVPFYYGMRPAPKPFILFNEKEEQSFELCITENCQFDCLVFICVQVLHLQNYG